MNNIEEIIKKIKPKFRCFSYIMKYDGITIEFEVKNINSIDKDIAKVEKVLKELNIIDFSIEKRKDMNNRFSVQFPNMIPKYNDEQINKMYKDTFLWLLDDSLRNKPDLTRQFIITNSDKYIKQAIKTYCRSNINRYKENENDYLQNYEYRQKLFPLFITCVDAALENK